MTALEGPVMVIAGPGSGKTRVLTYRIAHLINQGVPPWEILALTFTNKAAREMKDRIEKVVGSGAQRQSSPSVLRRPPCRDRGRRGGDRRG